MGEPRVQRWGEPTEFVMVRLSAQVLVPVGWEPEAKRALAHAIAGLIRLDDYGTTFFDTVPWPVKGSWDDVARWALAGMESDNEGARNGDNNERETP